jgi:hypothetical protein
MPVKKKHEVLYSIIIKVLLLASLQAFSGCNEKGSEGFACVSPHVSTLRHYYHDKK